MHTKEIVKHLNKILFGYRKKIKGSFVNAFHDTTVNLNSSTTYTGIITENTKQIYCEFCEQYILADTAFTLTPITAVNTPLQSLTPNELYIKKLTTDYSTAQIKKNKRRQEQELIESRKNLNLKLKKEILDCYNNNISLKTGIFACYNLNKMFTFDWYKYMLETGKYKSPLEKENNKLFLRYPLSSASKPHKSNIIKITGHNITNFLLVEQSGNSFFMFDDSLILTLHKNDTSNLIKKLLTLVPQLWPQFAFGDTKASWKETILNDDQLIMNLKLVLIFKNTLSYHYEHFNNADNSLNVIQRLFLYQIYLENLLPQDIISNSNWRKVVIQTSLQGLLNTFKYQRIRPFYIQQELEILKNKRIMNNIVVLHLDGKIKRFLDVYDNYIAVAIKQNPKLTLNNDQNCPTQLFSTYSSISPVIDYWSNHKLN